jgi:hypothetical protein
MSASETVYHRKEHKYKMVQQLMERSHFCGALCSSSDSMHETAPTNTKVVFIILIFWNSTKFAGSSQLLVPRFSQRDWDVMQYTAKNSLMTRRNILPPSSGFRSKQILLSASPSIPRMEAICSFETTVNFYRSTLTSQQTALIPPPLTRLLQDD